MRGKGHRQAGIALIVTLLLVALCQTAGAGHGPLVEVDWLRANLHRDDLVVLDTRSAGVDGRAASGGYIPGAVHAPYPGGWQATRGGIPGQLPPLAALEAHIGSLGISGREMVVLVPAATDASELAGATRVHWTLMLAGVRDVAILDGGFRAWLAGEGTPVVRAPRTPSPAAFTARLDPDLVVSSEEVRARLGDHSRVMLDARPIAQFAGREKSPLARRFGRLPGARHLDHARLFDQASGRLVSREAAASLLPAGLADRGQEIVSYCNTGHWASLNWFVLSQLLGYRKVTLFDDSMVGWTSDPQNPIEGEPAGAGGLQK